MKKLLCLVAILAVAGFIGMASAEETSPANWDNDLGHFGNKLRECTSGHTHDYVDQDTDTIYDPKFELGAGIDLVVYEADPERDGAKKLIPDEVTIEGKWDVSNQNGATYVVVKYNLWELLTKKK